MEAVMAAPGAVGVHPYDAAISNVNTHRSDGGVSPGSKGELGLTQRRLSNSGRTDAHKKGKE